MALKKYPNRRIYDEDQHRYVTLPSIRQRLMGGEPILCKTTGADVTAESIVRLVVSDISSGQGPDSATLIRLIESYTPKR